MREHGGLDTRELRALGLSPRDVLDFSVSVNPYGPTPAMVSAICEAAIDRYPDPEAREAREALGRACAVEAEEIVLGSGAADLLWTIARAILRPGAVALVVEPTFSEFRDAALAVEARVVEWRARAGDGFAIDGRAIAELSRETNAEALYVCAPNNPTGASFRARDLVALAESLPRTIVVVDQSFLSLGDDHADASTRLPANTIAVRSLTKDHAIPGVRIGYAVASAAIVDRLERSRPAWATGAAAQAAAVVAARESSFLAESRTKLAADRAYLAARLRGLGMDPAPSSAPFVLVAVERAGDLRGRLLARQGILVRDCASFGLPGHVRIAARPAHDVERLAAALEEEMK